MWRRQREDDVQSVIQFLRMTGTENLLPVCRRLKVSKRACFKKLVQNILHPLFPTDAMKLCQTRVPRVVKWATRTKCGKTSCSMKWFSLQEPLILYTELKQTSFRPLTTINHVTKPVKLTLNSTDLSYNVNSFITWKLGWLVQATVSRLSKSQLKENP